MKAFIEDMKLKISELSDVKLSVVCSDDMQMANANSFVSAIAGVDQIKCSINGKSAPSLEVFAHTMAIRGDSYHMTTGVKYTELSRVIKQMPWVKGSKTSLGTPFDFGTGSDDTSFVLNQETDIAKITDAVKKVGYELSEDDWAKVYKEFKRVVAKKDVGVKEFEAIIATASLQVAPTYVLNDFVINSGNNITPTAVVTLEKSGNKIKGLSIGDGPIEAAFLAIETIDRKSVV